MNETEFEAHYRDTLIRIEDALEDLDTDIDFETVNDILTLTFSDGSSVIFTKQSANNQLWLAARSGGFHFNYDAGSGKWLRTGDGATLEQVLLSVCSDQGAIELKL